MDELTANAGKINVIDCAIDEYALGDMLVLAARAAGIEASENFWFLEWANLFGSTLVLLRHFDLPEINSYNVDVVTLRKLMDAILLTTSGPQGPRRWIEELANRAREQSSTIPKDIRGDIEAARNQIHRFFRSRYVDTVMAFVSRSYGLFQRHQFQCFSPKYQSRVDGLPSFYDKMIDDGKLVLVSVSPADPLVAKIVCTLIKCLYQQSVIQRKDRWVAGMLRNFQRPLLLACDEYAEVATEVPGQPMGDGRFFSLAREFGCMGILATQSVNVLKATTLGENWRSVFSTFGAKIFMRLADNETAKEASDLAGMSDWYITSNSLSQGSEGLSSGASTGLQERSALPTSIMTQTLQTGDAVVIGSLDGGRSPPRLRFFHVPNDDAVPNVVSPAAPARPVVRAAVQIPESAQVATEPSKPTDVNLRDLDDIFCGG